MGVYVSLQTTSDDKGKTTKKTEESSSSEEEESSSEEEESSEEEKVEKKAAVSIGYMFLCGCLYLHNVRNRYMTTCNVVCIYVCT